MSSPERARVICRRKLATPGEPITMKYLHSMVRVTDLDASLDFFCNKFGMTELRRYESEAGRFTNVHLVAPGQEQITLELTYNWDVAPLDSGRNFGHLAYAVDDIYDICQRLMDHGVTINRPPRDGHMAFIRTPDGISIELLQAGTRKEPAEPWKSMPNTGTW